MVAHRHATVETVTALVHNPPLLLIVAMIGLTAGLAIVLGHNVWSGGALPVVVTLVMACCSCFPPEAAVELFERIHFEQFFCAYVAVSFIIGVYLTYCGFSSKWL
jgi:hypothetical protein